MILYKLIGIITFTLILCTDPILSEETCECIDGNECPGARYLVERGVELRNLRFCDDAKTKVWCNCVEIQHISEKICLGYANNLTDFCPHVPFIRNGEKTKKQEFPFMVKIEVKLKNSSEFKPICGGTLIDPKYALSAAHCFDLQNTTLEYFAVFGAYRRDDSESRTKVIVHPHPNFSSSSDTLILGNPKYKNDIALLELESKVDITTSKIRPACIAYDGEEYGNLTSIGWGKENDYSPSETMLKGSFAPRGACGDFDMNEKICVNSTRPFGSTCFGDSGGPLFRGYHGRENCLMEIIGVVSESTTQCESENPKIFFTKVYHYREWIADILWPEVKKTDLDFN